METESVRRTFDLFLYKKVKLRLSQIGFSFATSKRFPPSAQKTPASFPSVYSQVFDTLHVSGKDMDKRVGENVNEGRLHGVKGAAYEETM